jgi:hypothetical protein
MIRPLRRRHRHIVITMGVVLPLAFTLAIAARKPVPAVTSLPAELVTPEVGSATAVWDRSDLFAKTAIQVQLLRDNHNSSRFLLKLSAIKDFVKPDLIVYWVAQNITLDSLPESALLLGSFHSDFLEVPVEATAHPGALVLYSLANGEIVDVSSRVLMIGSAR